MRKLLGSTRFHAVLAWVVTAVFVIAVGIPLMVERVAVTDQSKTYFVSFELKDQDGRRHVGWFCPGFMYFMDIDFTEYGYEAPAGTDVEGRRQKFVDNRDKVKTDDGFIWGSNGFLWASVYKFASRGWVKEGDRLNAGRPIPITEQTEITLPGAPWDMQSPTTSVFGHWPNYEAKFSNEFFDFNYKMTAAGDGWQMYNNGPPFSAGDFGLGSMNEASVAIVGTITHKKSGKVFQVTGTGLMQDGAGVPWGYASWGEHDWTGIHFAGGWAGSIWKAKDDWQWGYGHGPHNGWIYDPELKKNHIFDRVEVVSSELETDPETGAQFPKHIVWRAVGATATLVMEQKSVSWVPGELKIPPSPISMKMAHGLMASTAQLIRRDGTTVDLKDGQLVAEHYRALFPDYVFFGPFMLVLLVLSWSAYAAAIRRDEKKSLVAPVAWAMLGLFAVFYLYYQWAHAVTVY